MDKQSISQEQVTVNSDVDVLMCWPHGSCESVQLGGGVLYFRMSCLVVTSAVCWTFRAKMGQQKVQVPKVLVVPKAQGGPFSTGIQRRVKTPVIFHLSWRGTAWKNAFRGILCFKLSLLNLDL